VKRPLRTILAFFVCLLFVVTKSYSQNSNIGTEFWTAYMDHVNGVGGASGSQMNLYIACDVATTVTISCADGSFSNTVNVVPNVITTFAVPTTTFLGNLNGQTVKGIHIVSQNPIAVYAHIYASSVSGATLLLPVNTLSNDYYSLNYTQVSNATAADPAYSAFLVIATADSTSVQITPSALLLDNSAANVPFTIKLKKGEVYQGLSKTDLTGTHISAISGTSGCKKIAVFSGSSKISIGTPNVTSDNLFQQVYPTPSWGKTYITVPLKNRDYDVFRVVVSDPTANVTMNGAPIAGALINNFYYQFNSQSPNYITADKPIQVIQYAVTQGNNINGVTNTSKTDVGDPEMIYINPLEQNIDQVTLYSPFEYKITQSYINVVIPTSAAASFVLDGTAPPGGFTAVPTNPAYSYGQFNVSSSTHNISANSGFNAIAYGFGQDESYGYAAGTNVKNLDEFIQYINPVSDQVATTGCINSGSDPEVVIPYQTDTITWDLGNGSAPVTQANPVYADTIHRNSQVLYVYNYGKPVTYAAGTYAVKVTVLDPISTICGSTEEIDLNYTVVDPPAAKFTSRDTVCTTDTVGFKDLTDGTVNAIKTWHWDFGTGDTSNVQNPVYHFLQSGPHTVTLTVTGSTGCSTSVSNIVYARVLPVANFKVQAPSCESPLSVTFTDLSVPSEGVIASWLWDFGDGATSTLQNPTHTYASAQSYTVGLTIITNNGCSNVASKSTVVNFSPTVDFTLPDVCQYDTFAHFTAIASVTDSMSDNLTYGWNFGDPTNTTSPNTATGKTVQHHFNGIGTYNVTLTVTTANGCARDTVKQLTVNGGNPQAAFTVLNSNALCSNQSVVFETNANVPGFGNGKVTSFTMNYGDGTAIQTLRIDSGQTFTHKYPIQYSTATPYTVTMTAYSGATCSNMASQTINILPVPETIFTPPAKICQNTGTLQLSSYVTEQAGGPAGTATFLIDGAASTNGTFNTATIGTGVHIITCYYTATATQCQDTSIKTITVEPIATVDAGPSLTVLAGGQVKLKATETGGNNVTYSWLPTIGLNNPSELDPVASPSITTLYTLTATSTTDSLSCPVSDTVTVTVLLAPVIPNTFTPNGDGVNDTWDIKYLDSYPGCTVEIYNRNGEKVFYSVGYGIAWDGRYNSVNLPVGTYYYIIDPKNGRSKISGPVTIIR
jgi:gliding motility-associated-like protein